jgi:hypothetical protein
MIESSNSRAPLESDSSREVADLIARDPRVLEQKGPFEFWYRWTSPAPQPLTASFELREQVRQGRLTSTVLAMVAGALTILAIPTSFATNNPALLGVLCVLLTTTGISLLLNKLGKGLAGRLLIVITVDVALAISIFTYCIQAHGISTNALPILDIFVVEPILMALVLLPPASAFIIAPCNAVYILALFYLMHHTSDLDAFMVSDGYEIVTRPLYLLIFVIGVVYPVMRSALRAIALGDRAKEIAKVQHDLANREAITAREKLALDQGIEQLAQTLTEINNGNMRVHIPFSTTEGLWPIAGGLNTLYARIRNARQKEYEYQHTKNAATKLILAIRLSEQNHQPLRLERTGNPIIDAIIGELSHTRSLSPVRDQHQGLSTGPLRKSSQDTHS